MCIRDRVEGVTERALLERAREPYLGANPLVDRELDIPENAVPVRSDQTGNIQYTVSYTHLDVYKRQV